MFRILAQSVADVNMLDVVTKVDSLYNNAYNRLTTIFIFGFGLVVIITGSVPFLIQWFHRRSLISEKDEILKQTKEEIKQLERNVRKALAADSAIHFLEHAKNLPTDDGYNIDKFCLVLMAAKNFAVAGEINGIHLSFEAVKMLKLPKVSYGKDIEDEHDRLLFRYDMAYTAIKEGDFEKVLTNQLKSIKKKIDEWYSNLKAKQVKDKRNN